MKRSCFSRFLQARAMATHPRDEVSLTDPLDPCPLPIKGTCLPKVLTAPREERAKQRARTKAKVRTSPRHPQDGLQTGRQQLQGDWNSATHTIFGITVKATVADLTTAQSQRMDGFATSLLRRTIHQSAPRPDRQPSLVLTVRWLGLSQQVSRPQSKCFIHLSILIQRCLFLQKQPLENLRSRHPSNQVLTAQAVH